MRCLLHNYPSAFHRVEYVRRGVRRMRLSPYKMSRDADSIPAAAPFPRPCHRLPRGDKRRLTPVTAGVFVVNGGQSHGHCVASR